MCTIRVPNWPTQGGQLGTAWFHRQQVRTSICELGSRDPLLIYAGAGVSIDRTGLNWSDFVVHLLSQRGYSTEMAKGLVHDLGPTGAASGAYELFADEYGDDTKAQITNELRLLLRQREFMGGHASRAIATLCIRAARQGKGICVATTNYDEYLISDAQSEAANMASAGAPVAGLRIENLLASGSGQTELAAPANGSASMVTITYLHGYVPDLAGVEAFPVVSEEDYLDARSETGEMASRSLRDSSRPNRRQFSHGSSAPVCSS